MSKTTGPENLIRCEKKPCSSFRRGRDCICCVGSLHTNLTCAHFKNLSKLIVIDLLDDLRLILLFNTWLPVIYQQNQNITIFSHLVDVGSPGLPHLLPAGYSMLKGHPTWTLDVRTTAQTHQEALQYSLAFTNKLTQTTGILLGLWFYSSLIGVTCYFMSQGQFFSHNTTKSSACWCLYVGLH